LLVSESVFFLELLLSELLLVLPELLLPESLFFLEFSELLLLSELLLSPELVSPVSEFLFLLVSSVSELLFLLDLPVLGSWLVDSHRRVTLSVMVSPRRA
jgi:hypothetical protein